MDLTELHGELGRLLVMRGELDELKRELDREKSVRADFERRCERAEKDLKRLRQNSKVNLPRELEQFLLKRGATIRYEATPRGKFRVQLKLGRHANNLTTEKLFDPEDKKALPLREVIEKALKEGR